LSCLDEPGSEDEEGQPEKHELHREIDGSVGSDGIRWQVVVFSEFADIEDGCDDRISREGNKRQEDDAEESNKKTREF